MDALVLVLHDGESLPIEMLSERLRITQQVRTNLHDAGTTWTPYLDEAINTLEDLINEQGR